MIRYIPSLITVLLLVLLACAPMIAWHFEPWQPLRLGIVDMTVPLTDYREHRSLVWVLNHYKLSSSPRVLDYASDYIGFHPGNVERPHSFRIQLTGLSGVADSLEAQDLSRYEALYLVDTYGIYRYVYPPEGERDFLKYEKTLPQERFSLAQVYAGITPQFCRQISAFKAMGGTLIAEFNTLGYPTDLNVGVQDTLEKLVGVRLTGWVGKYYYDLDLVDRRIKDLYETVYSVTWRFQGPGLVLLREERGDGSEGSILVFPETDLQSPPLTLHHEMSSDLFRRVADDVEFRYWFEILTPLPGSQALATFMLHLTPAAERVLEQHGIPTTFPAIVIQESPAKTLYLAGDFSDNPSGTPLVKFRGSEYVMRLLSRVSIPESRFYWQFYVPFLHNVLHWAHPTALDQRAYTEALTSPAAAPPSPPLLSPPRRVAPGRVVRRDVSRPPHHSPGTPTVYPVPPPPATDVGEAPVIPPTPQDSLALLHQRAQELSWDKRFEESIAIYRALLARDPDNRGLKTELARVYSWAEKYPQSVELYRQLLQADPTNRDLKRELARVYSWDRRYSESLSLYRELLAEDPRDVTTQVELARVASWTGKLNEARSAYEQILDAHPERTEVRQEYAKILGWTGAYGAAAKQYQQILKQEPQNVGALVGMAQIARYQGEPSWARRYLNQALQIDPNDSQAQEEKRTLSDEFRPQITVGFRGDDGAEFDVVHGVHYLDRKMTDWHVDFTQTLPLYLHVSAGYSRRHYWEDQNLFDGLTRRTNFSLSANVGDLGAQMSLTRDLRAHLGVSLYHFDNRIPEGIILPYTAGSQIPYYQIPATKTYVGGSLSLRARFSRGEVISSLDRFPYFDKVGEDPTHPLEVVSRHSAGASLRWLLRPAVTFSSDYRYSRYADNNQSHQATLRGDLVLHEKPHFSMGPGITYMDYARTSDDYWSPHQLSNPFAAFSVSHRLWQRVSPSLTYTLGYYREHGGVSHGITNSVETSLGIDIGRNLLLSSSFLYSENSQGYIYRYVSVALGSRW